MISFRLDFTDILRKNQGIPSRNSISCLFRILILGRRYSEFGNINQHQNFCIAPMPSTYPNKPPGTPFIASVYYGIGFKPTSIPLERVIHLSRAWVYIRGDLLLVLFVAKTVARLKSPDVTCGRDNKQLRFRKNQSILYKKAPNAIQPRITPPNNKNKRIITLELSSIRPFQNHRLIVNL